MTEFKISLLINRDIDTVVKAFVNPDNIPLYTKYLERFEIVKREPNLEGSVARLHYLEGGKRYVMEDRMLHVEPGRKYVSQVSGDVVEARVETTFERSGDGTQMTIHWNGKARMFFLKVLFPLMRGRMIKGAREELETFKGLVEAHGAVFPKPKGKAPETDGVPSK